MTLGAMQQLARYLGRHARTQNLIWLSVLFPLQLGPDDTLNSAFDAMRNYGRAIKETSEMLSAARVAIYPVDARVVGSTNIRAFLPADSKAGDPAAATPRQPSYHGYPRWSQPSPPRNHTHRCQRQCEFHERYDSDAHLDAADCQRDRRKRVRQYQWAGRSCGQRRR